MRSSLQVLALLAGVTVVLTASAPSAGTAQSNLVPPGRLSSSFAGYGQALNGFSDFQNNVFKDIFQNRWQVPPAPVWTSIGYTGTPSPDGSGIFEVSTLYGPGFRIVQNQAVPRGSGNGVLIADIDHFLDQEAFLGTISDFAGKVMFPRSGNPNGFPAFGDWNVLWEWTQDITVDNAFGVDALAPGGPRIYVATYNPANPDRDRKARARGVLKYNRWYDWRWQIKWSRESDGFVNFWVDGKRIASWVGPSLSPTGGAPYLEWGWYGGEELGRNEVRYAALRRR